jgi:hypothetical protein
MQAAYFLHTFAEDTLFEVLSVQAGASLTGTSTLGNWRVAVEALDTLGRTFSKQGFNKRQAASTFVNGIYTDGFGYRGRVISASLDGDSRLFTLSAALTDAKNRRWYAQARRADINVSNSTVYRVSQNRERLFLGEIGVDMPTRFGDLSLEARGQTDSPNSPGRKDAAAQVELRFKAYF